MAEKREVKSKRRRPVRGAVLREGAVFTAERCIGWAVTRSLAGGADECDCELDGVRVRTCSLKAADRWAENVLAGGAEKATLAAVGPPRL